MPVKTPTNNCFPRRTRYHEEILDGVHAGSQVLLSTAAIAGLIDRAVDQAVSARIAPELRRITAKPYLPESEVAELTGLSVRQLAYRRKSGSLPFYKRGRKVWYETQDVYDWIEAGYVPSKRGGAGRMTIDELLARLRKTSKSGSGYKACCPAHDDRNPSLSIGVGTEERILLKCHKGCSAESILEALDLSIEDLFAAPSNLSSGGGPTPSISKSGRAEDYTYVDDQGIKVGRVVRREGHRFHQERWESGRWKPGLEGRELPLYNLPDVRRAVTAGIPILVVEGERDCETAAGLGYTATTNAGGAGKWRSSHTKALVGADVVVIGDNDEMGKMHAIHVVEALLPEAKSVRMLASLPGVPLKGDLTDYVAAGNSREDLECLIDAVVPIHDSQSLGSTENVNREPGKCLVPLWGFEDPPPLRWFIQDVLPEGFTTILAAHGGTGKSYLALYLASCVLLGRDFFGHRTTPGRVLYVDYELDSLEQQRRWLRVLRGTGLDQHDSNLAGRFHWLKPRGPLGSKEGRADVFSAIEFCQPDLIVLDSLTLSMQGDASSQRDAVQVMREVQSWGTVLAIDHVSGASASGNMSSARPFGSVFKHNGARSVLTLARVDGGGRMLQATKSNFGSQVDLVCFAMDFTSEGRAVVFRQVDLAADEMVGGMQNLNARDITLLAVESLGMATAKEVVSWREDHDAPAVKPGTVRNHFTALKKAGKIELHDGTAYPKDALPTGTLVETPQGPGSVVEGPNATTGRVPVQLRAGGGVSHFERSQLSRSRQEDS